MIRKTHPWPADYLTPARHRCLNFFLNSPNVPARNTGITGKVLSDCYLAGWLFGDGTRFDPLIDWSWTVTPAGKEVILRAKKATT
jgi:hypothetical protein